MSETRRPDQIPPIPVGKSGLSASEKHVKENFKFRIPKTITDEELNKLDAQRDIFRTDAILLIERAIPFVRNNSIRVRPAELASWLDDQRFVDAVTEYVRQSDNNDSVDAAIEQVIDLIIHTS